MNKAQIKCQLDLGIRNNSMLLQINIVCYNTEIYKVDWVFEEWNRLESDNHIAKILRKIQYPI